MLKASQESTFAVFARYFNSFVLPAAVFENRLLSKRLASHDNEVSWKTLREHLNSASRAKLDLSSLKEN